MARTTFIILLFTFYFQPLCYAFMPDTTGNGNIITDGRYFLRPDEVPALKERLERTELYGIYLYENKVCIRRANNITPTIQNIKDRVHYTVPDHIQVKKKYIRNKRTGNKIQYVKLLTYPEPLVFLYLPGLQEGEQGRVLQQRVELPLNGNHRFSYEDADYMVIHSAQLHENDYPSDIRITLLKMDTGQEQLISVRNDLISTRSYIVFAGDIDGDGKLDLILDESPRSHHGHLKLYLSSYAEDGQLVGLAAEERNTEDAPLEQL